MRLAGRFTNKLNPEQIHINLARIKKNGKSFEIVVDPDKAVAFKQGIIRDIREVLKIVDGQGNYST